MLAEVDQGWERPKVFNIDAGDEEVGIIDSGILQKMKAIVVPQVNFSGMELTRVIDTLSELSVEYDPEKVGVNIVPLFDANESNPRVNISLRNLNLDRILEFVTQQVNFAYTVGADAVTVDASDATGGESSNVTEFFPISRATIIRLTGVREDNGGSSAAIDPFAAPSAGGGGAPATVPALIPAASLVRPRACAFTQGLCPFTQGLGSQGWLQHDISLPMPCQWPAPTWTTYTPCTTSCPQLAAS